MPSPTQAVATTITSTLSSDLSNLLLIWTQDFWDYCVLTVTDKAKGPDRSGPFYF